MNDDMGTELAAWVAHLLLPNFFSPRGRRTFALELGVRTIAKPPFFKGKSYGSKA